METIDQNSPDEQLDYSSDSEDTSFDSGIADQEDYPENGSETQTGAATDDTDFDTESDDLTDDDDLETGRDEEDDDLTSDDDDDLTSDRL